MPKYRLSIIFRIISPTPRSKSDYWLDDDSKLLNVFKTFFVSRYWSWSLVKVLKNILGQDFEAEIWSRFWSWSLVNIFRFFNTRLEHDTWHGRKISTCWAMSGGDKILKIICLGYFQNSKLCHLSRRMWAIFEIMISPDHVFY